MTWRLLEHDADTGLRVEADSPEELLADLLYATLSEALSLAMARRIAVSRVEIVEFAPGRARASLRGEPFDAARHALGIEVKAVTRHGLRLETCPLKPGAASLVATVYFDV